jgi:hypothetical protein
MNTQHLTIENFETKILGRPVNPNSVRQQRLQDLEQRRQNGTLKLGRPVVENSERQKRLQELEEKRQNGELRRGRPVNGESKRQKQMIERETKLQLGIEIKRGRPKMVQIENNEIKISDVPTIEDLINEEFGE